MIGSMGRRVAIHEGPEKLRRWRTEHDLTQAELGAQLGFTERTAISQYEAGLRPLTYKRLLKASALTGIPLWDLAWPGQREELVALAKRVPRHLVLLRGDK